MFCSLQKEENNMEKKKKGKQYHKRYLQFDCHHFFSIALWNKFGYNFYFYFMY